MKTKNERKITIFKFGGSALANKNGQQTLKNKVLAARNVSAVRTRANAANAGAELNDGRLSVFVLSAIGKIQNANAEGNDEKLTDLLIFYDNALKTKNAQEISLAQKLIKNKLFNFFRRFYADEKPPVKKLPANEKKTKNEQAAIKKAENAFNLYFAGNFYSSDELISRGEFFTAKTFSQIFGGEFFDSKNLVFIKNNGRIDFNKTKAALKNAVNNYPAHKKPPFITGFYGNLNGKTKLFKRGGGDLSGAVLSNCLNARLYVNYTDVNGIKNAPPAIIKIAKTFKKISYGNLKLLCLGGANVLSEQSALLICRKKIKTKIKNALNLSPCAPATVTSKKQKDVFKAITFKQCVKNADFVTVFMFGKGLKNKKCRKNILYILRRADINAVLKHDKKSVRLMIEKTNAEKAIKLLYDNFIK